MPYISAQKVNGWQNRKKVDGNISKITQRSKKQDEPWSTTLKGHDKIKDVNGCQNRNKVRKAKGQKTGCSGEPYLTTSQKDIAANQWLNKNKESKVAKVT